MPGSAGHWKDKMKQDRLDINCYRVATFSLRWFQGVVRKLLFCFYSYPVHIPAFSSVSLELMYPFIYSSKKSSLSPYYVSGTAKIAANGTDPNPSPRGAFS